MKRAGVALVLVLGVAFGSTASAGGGDSKIAPGYIKGREHEVRIRSVLGELPKEAKKISRSVRETGEQAIATCDPVQVGALAKVPTTTRDGDDPAACVVVDTPNDKKSERLLLGPARLTGSELDLIVFEKAGRGKQTVKVQLTEHGVSAWSFHSAQVAGADLAVTLDGEVVDLAPINESPSGVFSRMSIELGPFASDEAGQLRDRLQEAAQEEVIELAREASLSNSARALFARNNPHIRDKVTFADDCPLPEADETFVLGCYDGSTQEIAILRVERADLAGVMPVTAAHEMLHAAYEELDQKAKSKVDAMIDDFLAEVPQPDIEAELEVYTERERANEVHSLVGTEVRELSPALEKYYGKFFDDRLALIALFENYEALFKFLEDRYVVLTFELAALEEQLTSIEGQATAAGNEADSLGSQIDSLRAQGRIDESNNLVGPQNAAVDRANSLVAQYNSLVDQYNAKVAELNKTGQGLNDLYSEFTPA